MLQTVPLPFPLRQIVFNPDGQTFDIAVDKLREDQLAAAAEAAAAERRRAHQRAAAAALGPGGARQQGGSRAEQLDPDVVAWRATYARQKVCCALCVDGTVRFTTCCMASLAVWVTASSRMRRTSRLRHFARPLPPFPCQLLVLLSLTADVIYLVVLLVLRLAWGGNGEASAPSREFIHAPAKSSCLLLRVSLPWLGVGVRELSGRWEALAMAQRPPTLFAPYSLPPAVGTAAKFFAGSHPDTTSISFISGTIFTGKPAEAALSVLRNGGGVAGYMLLHTVQAVLPYSPALPCLACPPSHNPACVAHTPKSLPCPLQISLRCTA